MSKPYPQTPSNRAALVLENTARLSGELAPTADDTRWLFKNVQLESAPEGGGKISIKSGLKVKLLLVDAKGTPSAPVLIQAISNNILTLEFTHPNSPQALHCLQVLAGEDLVEPIEATVVPQKRSSTETKKSTPITGSNTKNTGILREFKALATTQLHGLLTSFMSDLYDYLVDISDRQKTPSEGARTPFYEAAQTLHRESDAVVNSTLSTIETYFTKLVPGSGEDTYWKDATSSDDLGLVDLEEFEGYLAIDRVVALADELHMASLEAMLIRIASLIDADPLDVRLPVHARQLSRAFQRALEELEIKHETLTASYDFFARQFIRKLGDYYAALNEQLVEHQIKPGLEAEIRQKGSLLKQRNALHHSKRAEAGSVAAGSTGTGGNNGYGTANPMGAGQDTSGYLSAQFSPGGVQNMYQSVVDALNFRREAEGLSSTQEPSVGIPMSGSWDGRTVPSSELNQQLVANAQTIVQALSSIQRDTKVHDTLQETSSLREYLANNRNQLTGLQNSSGLTSDSLNQLDMVDNLFGTIKTQLDVSSDLKPALANLQIPLAKLALLDPQFFLEKGHTARGVIDKLSKLSTTANFPNPALEARIGTIVEEIVNDYEHDEAVFDRALEQVDKLSTQQSRALTRNIERVVKTQEGQEKLLKARRAVNDAINQRIRPPSAPRVLLDLLESGGRDLLILTHIKEGPDSANWNEYLSSLDLLNSWLTQKEPSPAEMGHSEQNDNHQEEDLLLQRGLEAETLLDMIEQQFTAALPTNISHQDVLNELREILANQTTIEWVEITEESVAPGENPEQVRSKIETLPRLRRWVRRVEQLEPNSWLSYQDDDGKKRRMQLAWISEAKDRYLFVNERGQKVADLSAIQLARKLSKGVQPPAPADDLPVVDQSMYQTLEHVQKTLSFARNHDSLTRLINRETFLEQLAQALRHAQQKNVQHTILYLDIDQFSLVNELYDRVNGDQVLLEFSQLLAQTHGKKSSSARIKDDQFAILLLDRSVADARIIAEKIRTDIEAAALDIDGEKVSFTVSIGIAPIAAHSPSVDKIMDAAKAAKNHAKESGRNCVQVYQEDKAQAGEYETAKKETRENLEQALATDRFLLRAQPIVKTAVDGHSATKHYELLLAITNPDGSLSSPGEFIESAERYGFMTLVDRWVVKEAFSWISSLMDAEKEVPSLAINLSGSSVTNDAFLEYVLEQISEFGVGTSRICFEITETGTISNLVKAADFVRCFRNIGCKFSIDDFGTGLASHNYLRELPVDYVKIDGTFVTGIHENRSDYAMARSINDLAHFLGQETIAESVENDQIVDKLREIGVDYLQGWGIGKPKPLSEITDDLSSLAR